MKKIIATQSFPSPTRRKTNVKAKSKTSKKKILVILGPTATGKTDLATKIAHRFHGEIISADSRTIYKDLNIGTAKPPGKWKTIIKNDRILLSYQYKDTPHYMIDFLSPKKTFSAHDFATHSRKLIKKIDLPIIVGGTGFWIDALIKEHLLGDVPPNLSLRKKLEKKSVTELFKQLKKLDSKRARTIQKTNKRRLVRAIEISTAILRAKQSGIEKQKFRQARTIKYNTLFLGLNLPNAILKKRIRKRFLIWLKRGLVSETKRLRKTVSRKRIKEIGLMYPIIADYLDGKIDKKEMIERSVSSIYHYAKRQKTWFKKNKNIHWIKTDKQALGLAKKFLA